MEPLQLKVVTSTPFAFWLDETVVDSLLFPVAIVK